MCQQGWDEVRDRRSGDTGPSARGQDHLRYNICSLASERIEGSTTYMKLLEPISPLRLPFRRVNIWVVGLSLIEDERSDASSHKDERKNSQLEHESTESVKEKRRAKRKSRRDGLVASAQHRTARQSEENNNCKQVAESCHSGVWLSYAYRSTHTGST